MRRILPITVLLLLVGMIPAHADEESAKISRDLSGMRSGVSFSGHKYEISWSLTQYDGRKVKNWVGGDSLDPPSHVFRSLKLRIDGIEVPVPKGAYYDIYDPLPNGPYIMDDGRVLYLVIKASDGAGSAEVWIRIENRRIVTRRIKQFTPDGEYKFGN